jgi:hypothetical protein
MFCLPDSPVNALPTYLTGSCMAPLDSLNNRKSLVFVGVAMEKREHPLDICEIHFKRFIIQTLARPWNYIMQLKLTKC